MGHHAHVFYPWPNPIDWLTCFRASAEPQCWREREERQDADQGNVVDQGAAVGTGDGFVDQGAASRGEHEQEKHAVGYQRASA